MTMLAQPRSRLWDILDAGTLREMGLTLLIVSLVLFVSAMLLLGANVSELRQGYARVQQSNGALLELASVDTEILRVEMTVRGYVLSGDPMYLTWKQMETSALQDRVASFDSVFRDDPAQMANVKTLKRLLNEHRVFFDDLSRRAPSDRAAVIADIIAYSKRVGRRSIEDHLLTMRANEMKSLAQQQLLAETRVVNAYRNAIGISAAALLFASLGFTLLLQDRRRSRRRNER
ncbi:MAG: CHASE3 domain-containing protein [Rhizomicrobium sp.]|nr:CHASE3 domain-containing protein [Rhizomicrobium sp.]